MQEDFVPLVTFEKGEIECENLDQALQSLNNFFSFSEWKLCLFDKEWYDYRKKINQNSISIDSSIRVVRESYPI